MDFNPLWRCRDDLSARCHPKRQWDEGDPGRAVKYPRMQKDGSDREVPST